MKTILRRFVFWLLDLEIKEIVIEDHDEPEFTRIYAFILKK